jgi:hypothetical protein
MRIRSTARRNTTTRNAMAHNVIALTACLIVLWLASSPSPARAQKKDYLSQTEADKLRDSDTPTERIKLLISFAADRVKKLQYEFAHPGDTLHRAERLNALINGYSGCLDDAAELIDLGVEKQQDVREGIKTMQARAPEFLAYFKDLAAKAPEGDAYKDNIDDAVDATSDAIRDADEAAKENAPPPVRRRPN